MRILLADDNEMNVEFFLAALEGHDVAVERDGASALATALRGGFDLLLLDVQMPGKSGIEVCRALRGAGVRVPILAVTADAMAADRDHGLAAGFSEYLTKPITPAALRSAVERYAAR